MYRARLCRLLLPAVVLLFGCQLFEPLPTLPPVLTLEPLATEATTGVLLPANHNTRSTYPGAGDHPIRNQQTALKSPTKTATRPALAYYPSPEWNEVPIMAGATHGAEDQGSYSYTVNASVADVQAYYEQQMPAAGWESLVSGEGAAGNLLLMYQKGDITATIGIIAQEDNTQVLIVAE